GADAVARERMDDRGPQARSLPDDLHHARVRIVETFVGSLRRKTGERRQPLRAAERLDIFIKYLIRGRLTRGLRKRFTRLVRRRSAVQERQAGHDVGTTSATMTGVTGHHLPSPEVRGVE